MVEANIAQPVSEVAQSGSESISDTKAHRAWVKPLVRSILFGIISVSAYLLLFLNEGTVTEHFSRGGVYTLAVVGTAIAFSLIHGTFANYVLELVGIRPKDSH